MARGGGSAVCGVCLSPSGAGIREPMLKDGPIPRFLHGFIEYAAGVLLIVAPFLLSFESGAAVAAAILAGIVVLFLAAATDGPTSLINYVPLAAHVVLDYVLAGLLIAMPFIAGFSDETAPTAFFIALGVLHLLVTIGTRFKKRDEPSRRRRSREPAREPSPPPA
jgi:VIT1/CCC1 family predicted Fe2+/Mn2+ transporter